MSPEREKARADEAKHLLEHPLLVEAFQAIESRLVDQLAVAELTPERRDRLQTLLASGRLYRKYLENVVAGGALAAAQIEQDKQRSLAARIFRAA